jgi:hypothetical protein
VAGTAAGGERPALSSSFELLARERPPELVDDLGQVAVELRDGSLEVFAPKLQPGRLCERLVAGGDVHLRWVVERTIAWLHQYRRLRVRYERRADIHEAFLHIACSLICFRQLQAEESLSS